MIDWLSQFDFTQNLDYNFEVEQFSITSTNIDYLATDVYKGQLIELPMNALTNLDS
jgi:hypothetical protein